MQTTIARALQKAVKTLRDNQISDARLNAQLLLGKVLAKNLTFLIAHDDEFLTDEQFKLFFNFVERRTKGEPVQHLVGRQEFYGLDFEVNKDVLIPRSETEFMVAAALEILAKQTVKSFCDVGTGSGAIAVSILKNLPEAIGVAIDISPAALTIARRNAEKNKVAERLQFIESDLFSALTNSQFTIHNSQFDVILSNPPYIPDSDLPDLQLEVRNFDPHLALFAGADGLDVIRRLLTDAPQFLTENGYLLFEIGFGQSAAVQQLINRSVWHLNEIRPDLQNIPRIIILQLI